MRRLDLYPQKKLRNPSRHLRSLERWSRSFADFFPSQTMAYQGLWYEKIPVFQKVVAPPHTTVELQRICAQLMIDAAERLRDARPGYRESSQVYAFLTFPDMFGSFVEVAFEPRADRGFTRALAAGRQGVDDAWREYFDLGTGRLHGLDLRIPPGFEVSGAGLRSFESDWMTEPQESEEWIVGELR